MNARQERRLLLAAIDYADADFRCRLSQHSPATVSRSEALKARRLAKARLLRAAGSERCQQELGHPDLKRFSDD